ncbi:MAG TPA: hypothetical protein VLC95_19095 [Anaerolineae bacterium]|nr:hypothetical protein [Anaerolineae bacterium]
MAHSPRSRAGLVWQALILAVVLLAFGLRLHYAASAEAFVDEPTTLLVAKAIAGSGLPVLPSGLFYGNDLPFSYLAGAIVALTGADAENSLLAVRLLTVAAAVGTVVVVAVAGRRFFGPWVGAWAALLVALDPEAIVWGGRARAYGVLGLLSFGGLALFYAGVRGAEGAQSRGLRRGGLALMVIALFVHPEAALLLPAVVVSITLLRGVRWWLEGTRWIEMGMALATAAGRYALQLALARGVIGSFETVAGSRPPVEIVTNPLVAVQEIAPFFVAAGRLPWTLLALAGTVAAAWAWHRGRRDAYAHATLFFATCLWIVPIGMVLFFGETYQSPRYLAFLIPVLALCGAAGLSWVAALWHQPNAPTRQPVLPAAAICAVLLVVYLPGAVLAAGTREKGFVTAMAYVSKARQAGDRVATVAPATCHLYLGQCDYFALGIDYEEFVYRDEDGRMVDRWLGSPLIRDAGELNEVLDGDGRLWLVVDEGRLRRRFDPAFAQAVWQRMEIVQRSDDVLVFRSMDEEMPAVVHSTEARLEPGVALVGYALPAHDRATAANGEMVDEAWGELVALRGERVPLVLYWQANQPQPRYQATVFVHLLDASGKRYAQDDGPPLGGVQPMTHWVPGEVLPDRRVLELPQDLAPGRYLLVAGLYDPDTGNRSAHSEEYRRVRDRAVVLDYVRILEEPGAIPTGPQVALDVVFEGEGDVIRLLGYDLHSPTAHAGQGLELVLYWQAVEPVSVGYSTFVHVLDAAGEIQSQDDGEPLGGFYPTTFWDPGEIVVDRRVVAIEPGVRPGSYRLAVGLYILSPARRLQTPEGDRLVISEVQVVE